MNINEMSKISIDYNDLKSKSVQVTKEGKVCNIKTSSTTDCAVHKEMDSNIVYTNDLDKDEKKQDASDQLCPSDMIPMCLTGEDVATLDDEKTPLEEYSSSQISRAIVRIKKNREETKESIEGQVDKERVKEDNIEKISIQAAVEGTVPPGVVEQLAQANLPMTQENAIKLGGAATMAQSIESLTPSGVNQIVGSGKVITPALLRGTNGTKTTDTTNKEGFEQIQPQVEKILTDSKLDVNPENIQTAKYLYDNNLPITADNITCYNQIKNLQSLDPDTLVNRIVDAMVDGVSPENADLTQISREEAKDAVNDLVNCSDDTLRKTYTTEADFITAKRQLEEIRLKLTIDAARTMVGKGINIDTTNLQKIVEELKNLEQEACKNILEENQYSVTTEKVTQVSDTISLINQIAKAPSQVLGSTFTKGMDQTLDELATAGTALQETMEQKVSAYETVGTQVRSDLGDSIKKAFQNVDDILGDLSLDTTDSNRRAVRILAYNQMPITQESIAQMKEYDTKVNQVIEQLKPSVVAKMVENQIDPRELTLEELSTVSSELSEESDSTERSFSKFLWKLDKAETITPEQRKSMIGVFRLLDKVEKSDGAVVGELVKEGREITLNSLLSAVRTQASKNMNYQVDDDFGGLEEVVTKSEKISDQIGAAFSENTISQLKKNISPTVIQTLGSQSMTSSIEQLLIQCANQMTQSNEEQDFYSQQAKEIREAVDNSKEATDFLEALSLPDTLTNLSMAKAYLESNVFLQKPKWSKEEADKLKEALDDPEELLSTYDEVDQRIQEDISSEMSQSDMTYERLKAMQTMNQRVEFYGQLRKKEMYEVPIVTENGTTTLNITIQRQDDNQQAGTTQIAMETQLWGMVKASFQVNDKTVKGFVTLEKKDSAEQMKDLVEQVKNELEDQGFVVDTVQVAIGSRAKVMVGNKEENSTTTRSLYQVAKAFVVATTAQLSV